MTSFKPPGRIQSCSFDDVGDDVGDGVGIQYPTGQRVPNSVEGETKLRPRQLELNI